MERRDPNASAEVHPEGATKRDALFVASLAKGFDVLEAYSDAPGPLSVAAISDAIGQNRSSVQRTVHTLIKIGYLEQEESSRLIRPSPRCLEMAHIFMRCDTIVDRAWPLLVDCHQRCTETVNLSQLTQGDIILVSRLPSLQAVSVKMNIGARAPAFCTAPGRALLAHRPQEQVSAILDRGGLIAYTRHTRTDPAAIREELVKVRELGFAVQAEELTLGDISLAAPVLSPDGSSIAAVNISVPTSRWTLDALIEKFSSLVQETAQAISQTLRDRATLRRQPETFRT